MPKKSRRLPGGRVRKPIARPVRPAATDASRAEDDGGPLSRVPDLATAEPALSRPAFAPVRLRPAQLTQTVARGSVSAAPAARGGPVASPARPAPAMLSRARPG